MEIRVMVSTIDFAAIQRLRRTEVVDELVMMAFQRPQAMHLQKRDYFVQCIDSYEIFGNI